MSEPEAGDPGHAPQLDNPQRVAYDRGVSGAIPTHGASARRTKASFGSSDGAGRDSSFPLDRASKLVLGLVFAHAFALPSGCAPKKDPRCADRSATQCAWDKAITGGRPRAAQGEEVERWYEPTAPQRTREDEWRRATEILGETWTLMGEGVQGEAVAAEARKWCDPELPVASSENPDDAPATQTKKNEGTWSCDLVQPPRFEGRDLRLEVGKDGVVALSVARLGEGEATSLVTEAAEQWVSACSEGAFSELPARGAVGAYQGCTLHDGPLLVLSRFLPDPQSPLWQVSLSVMPAG